MNHRRRIVLASVCWAPGRRGGVGPGTGVHMALPRACPLSLSPRAPRSWS